MKLISYIHNNQIRAGAYVQGKIYRLSTLYFQSTDDIKDTLAMGNERIAAISAITKTTPTATFYAHPEEDGCQEIIAPVPNPGIAVDGYAFRQHVESARRNRNLSMIPAYDEFPVLYYMNPRSICGQGNITVQPDHLEQLDFELEVAAVIGKPGKNIKAEDADQHIAGLMILNDLSARKLQMEEMQLSLGPAKGKDFATATGPWLVTLDELEHYEIKAKPGHTGKSWKLDMRCKVNGRLVSQGNLADMDWTFAELIERASYGCELKAGDIIGSGTVGTGCFLELNGTHNTNQWLQDGDRIEMEVTALGNLRNTIVASKDDHSILKRKKQTA